MTNASDFLHWTQDSLIRKGFFYIPKSQSLTFNSDWIKQDPQEFDGKIRRLLGYGQLNEVFNILGQIYGNEVSQIFQQDPETRFRFFIMRNMDNKPWDKDEYFKK